MEAVGKAAEKLSEENQVVRLDGIYSMFQVSLQMPATEFATYSFHEFGIKEGVH